MSIQHHCTIRSSVLPSSFQGASDSIHLALPYGRTSVGVWKFSDLTAKPLELKGHRKSITALALSHRHPGPLLCSCAEDYVILWDLHKARIAVDEGHQVRGTVIGKLLGYVQYCAFSHDDQCVALCVDRTVLILDTREDKLLSTLEGHISTVHCAEFCPHYTSTVVTASADRTFKVWDISSANLIYQSTIISSSPFVSLTMDPVQEQFAIGTTDGQVRVYDMRDGNGFRCLHHLDVDRTVSKLRQASSQNLKPTEDSEGPVTISSKPSWKRAETLAQLEDDDVENEAEAGCVILTVHYWYTDSVRAQTPTPRNLPFLQQDTSLVSDLLSNTPLLVIGTTAALLLVNARTLEPVLYQSLQDPVLSLSVLEEPTKSLSVAGSVVLADNPISNQVWCCLGSLFQGEVHVLSISQPKERDRASVNTRLSQSASSSNGHSSSDRYVDVNIAAEDSAQKQEEITVLSSVPLADNSLLKAELSSRSKEKDSASAKRASWSGRYSRYSQELPDNRAQTPGMLDKKGKIVDNQSLTFKSKVKSSGYGASAPRTDMFKPKINSPKKSPAKLPKSASVPSSTKMVVKEYPMNSEVPTEVHTKLDVAERPTAINSITFSDDGTHLACALANRSCQVFKVPLSGKGYAFVGHNGSVTSSNWSKDGKWLITSSDDRTASVWSTSLSDPVMTFQTVTNNFSVDKEGGIQPTKDNPVFPKEVKHGQFYYMDKFILMTSGNTFYLYKYILDTVKADIKRYLSNNRYKLVQSFQMEQAQSITAFSAVNSFYSYIVLTAGSNKSLEVFDMNKGQSVRVMPDAHTRPAHQIALNEGSSYVTHTSSAYDLFVTSAASDCIKLWDLRTNRCVQRYEGHANRIHPCGLSFSPCSRFIATGSEDRCAYIFDVRAGTYLHKLVGHTEKVGDVAFHPLYPQLVTATLDGKLRLFKEK